MRPSETITTSITGRGREQQSNIRKAQPKRESVGAINSSLLIHNNSSVSALRVTEADSLSD